MNDVLIFLVAVTFILTFAACDWARIPWHKRIIILSILPAVITGCAPIVLFAVVAAGGFGATVLGGNTFLVDWVLGPLAIAGVLSFPIWVAARYFIDERVLNTRSGRDGSDPTSHLTLGIKEHKPKKIIRYYW